MRAAATGLPLAGLLVGITLAGCPAPCGDGDVCAVMGTGLLGFNGDGAADETHLASPTSVREDPDGRPLVVDFSNMRLRVLDEDGMVRTVVGNGLHAFSEPGADRLATPLENPIDARYGPDGLLYIAPLHEGRVIRVDGDGRVERVACTGTSLDEGGDGGDALDATMGFVGGIAFGPDGTLYISDNSNHQVRAVELGGAIHTVLGTAERGFDAEGVGTEVRLNSPVQMTVVGGELWVVDSGNHRVAALDLETGLVRTAVGTGTEGYSGDGGDAADATLSDPFGIATDGETVWVADLGNKVVREIDGDGVITTVIAGSGEIDQDEARRAFDPMDAPVFSPAGLHVAAGGDLLMTDRGTHRVLRWMRGE